eukprot:jgi/Chlat1/6701/Chrsp5S06985
MTTSSIRVVVATAVIGGAVTVAGALVLKYFNEAQLAAMDPSKPGRWPYAQREAANRNGLELGNKLRSQDYLQARDAIFAFKHDCESRQKSYADAFLTGDCTSEQYQQVDAARKQISGIWRQATRSYRACQLADAGSDMFSRNRRWLRDSNEMRVLVEPIDIANWYKCKQHLPEKGPNAYSGHYADHISKPIEESKRPSWYAFVESKAEAEGLAVENSVQKAFEYKKLVYEGKLVYQSIADARATPPVGFKRLSPLQQQAATRTMDWQYDVFISHAGEDKEFADELHHDLKQLGMNPFLDKCNLAAGDAADAIMLFSARRAPVGVAIMGRTFSAKTWPMKELYIVVTQGTLLPVALGISYQQLESDLRASPQKRTLGKTDEEWETFVKQVVRTTMVLDNNQYRRRLRDEIVFHVVRKYVEMCPQLPDTKWGARRLDTALAAVRGINPTRFPDLPAGQRTDYKPDGLRVIVDYMNDGTVSWPVFVGQMLEDKTKVIVAYDEHYKYYSLKEPVLDNDMLGRRTHDEYTNILKMVVKDFWYKAWNWYTTGLLPVDFFSNSKPSGARGNTCKLFAEPIDIANYYRLKLWEQWPEGNRHYLEANNRPVQYVFLELQYKKHNPYSVAPLSTAHALREADAVEARAHL